MTKPKPKPKPKQPAKQAAAQHPREKATASLWNYAAAAAAWWAAEAGSDWEDDGAAAVLLLVAEGEPLPAALAAWQAGGGRPARWRGFGATVERLLAATGPDLDIGRLRDRQIVELHPYAVRLCADPEHPMFDRRCGLAVDEGMVRSIDAVGEVVEVLQATPHRDRDGLHLYSGSGSRRTKAVRVCNARRVAAWFRQVSITPEAALKRAGPPALIRSVHYKIYREGKSRELAARVANQHRLAEDVVREADSAAALIAGGLTSAQVAAALGFSDRKVANLLSLRRLAPELLAATSERSLPVVCAYRLATELSQERQREAAAATATIRSGAKRRAAIDAWLLGEVPPPEPPRRSSTKILDHVLPRLPEGPFAIFARALTGDGAALRDLPEEIQRVFHQSEPAPAPLQSGDAHSWDSLGLGKRQQKKLNGWATPGQLAGPVPEEWQGRTSDPPAATLAQLFMRGAVTTDELWRLLHPGESR